MEFEVFVKIPYMGQLRAHVIRHNADVCRFEQSDPYFDFLANEVSCSGRLPITCSEVISLTASEFEERRLVLEEIFKIIATGEFENSVTKKFTYADEKLQKIYFTFNQGEGAEYVPATILIHRVK